MSAVFLARLAARCGLVPETLIQSLGMVAAAFLALLSAWCLGLDHPQWAAITVLVTIQPSRGQTLEKGLYRFFGTLLGSGVGLLLLLGAGGHPWVIATGLALWSGLCLFLGTLQRAYRSYAMVLAGYSAVIVAMNNPGPAAQMQDVALDRVASIFVGLLAGVAVSYLISPPLDRRALDRRARRVLADALAASAASLAQPGHGAAGGVAFPPLAAAARFSAELATLSSHRGGPDQGLGALQDLLVCATNLLLTSARAGGHPELAADLAAAAQALEDGADFAGLQLRLGRALARAGDPVLAEALLTLATALPDPEGADRGLALAPAERHWNYDWRGARQAGLRIALVTGGIGAVWALSGQLVVHFALISAAIVVSLASSGVAPRRAMADVCRGQVLAAIAAVLVEKLLWAQGLGGLGQVVAMVPALLGYALIRGHRRTHLSATDYSLTLLLLLTPGYGPYVQTFDPYLKALMAVSGGVIGYVSFRWLVPVDPRQRRKMLWRMIKAELQAIAGARPLAQGSAQAWRLRFAARFLRILDWSSHELQADPAGLTLRKGVLTLALADLIFQLRRLLRRAELQGADRRAVAACLQRLSRTERETPELSRALGRVAARLAGPAASVEGAAELCGLIAEVNGQIEDLRALRLERQRGFLARLG